MTTTAPSSPPQGPIHSEDFNTAEELLNALSPTNYRWQPDPTVWIFRGQRDATWNLVPGALRPNALRAYAPGSPPAVPLSTSRETIEAEWSLIREFVVAADHAGLSIPEDSQQLRSSELRWLLEPVVNRVTLNSSPEWPPNSLLSLFALAQHYGVPTRLLDWSWKPKVSAYMACEAIAPSAPSSARTSRAAVWATRTNFIEEFWATLNPRIRLVTAPQATNPNLHAQAGLFTVDGAVWDPRPFDALVVHEFAHLPQPPPPGYLPVLRKLTFPHSEADRLLRLLAYEHVNGATVYPGHDGVVRGLRERWSWR
jgi:hypothetical protein